MQNLNEEQYRGVLSELSGSSKQNMGGVQNENKEQNMSVVQNMRSESELSECSEREPSSAGGGGGLVQIQSADQAGAEPGAECAVRVTPGPDGVGGGGAVCERRGRRCVTHRVIMIRKAVKERVWRRKADGLFGNRTVVRSVWICGVKDSPKTVSQSPQSGGQGVFQTAVLCDEIGGELDHRTFSMDYQISAARTKRLRE